MKLFSSLLCAALLVVSPVMAQTSGQGMDERRSKWESLSESEKVRKLEKRRSEYRERRDAEWNSMSDEEKIRHAEKMMHKKKQ